MRPTYVRFVTTRIDKSSGRRQGIFQAAAELADADELCDDEREEFEALGEWFSEHLEKPDRFSRSPKSNAAPLAISWFKATAAEHVRRVRSICRILSEHGIHTEMITSARPGYIVFEDEHQVTAVPFAETKT
jgi:hypothetical protein